MIDWLLEPLRQGIVVRGVAELVLIGVVSGGLGCWIVFSDLSYSAESLAPCRAEEPRSRCPPRFRLLPSVGALALWCTTMTATPRRACIVRSGPRRPVSEVML